MTRTHWWTLSAVLSLALTGAAQAQCSHTKCSQSPCGGSGGCSAPVPACGEKDAVKDEDAAKDEDVTKDDEAADTADDEAAPAEPKCTCESCECKDGKCECKSCKCAKCAGAKSGKCDCAKCDCGCEKCKCSKAAAKTGCCPTGCCAKSCCSKGCCGKKTCTDEKEADKSTGESEYVSIVLEDLTINYFGAGMKIKKIKVRYKGQGVEAGDVAKDLSSIGCVPRICCPATPCCVPAPMPPPPPSLRSTR